MAMECGFSSPRAVESFPAGLRVLVVDDDPTWLKILEKMLKKCSYDVTTCGLAREALKLLRERKEGFDIVISDVNMPDMDGFKLLEHVGLEMDLPVIMMSVDGETSRVMKGVQHGACDYLLKPIRMKELKNIWQHVYRKRMHEVRDIESLDSMDDVQLFRNSVDFADDGHFFGGADQAFLRKRKDNGDKDSNDPSAAKKPRVVWSVDLHQKFVKAVNHIGFDKVGPKKILDLMNVPWLTRENVASHLQKYRLYLSRLQKENELKSVCGGLKSSDQSIMDAGVSFGVQNPTSVNIRCPDYKLPIQSADSTKPHEIGPKGVNLSPLTEPGKPFNSDILDAQKATISPNMGLECSLGPLKPDISFAPFECPLASQFAWSGEVKHPPYEFECKPRQQEVHVPTQHIQARLTAFQRENLGIIDTKLLEQQPPPYVGQATGLFAANTLADVSHQSVSESAFGSWTDDLSHYSFQGDNFATMGFDNLGFPDQCSLPGLINEAPLMCFSGVPSYDFEYPSDSMEYAGLSISSR